MFLVPPHNPFKLFNIPQLDLDTSESSSSRLSHEIVHMDRDIQLVVDVPGVKLSDLEVSVDHDGSLTVSGNRTVSYFEGKAVKKSKIEKRFLIDPETTDLSRVEADLADGVLTICAPKKPKAEPRKIKITVNKGLESEASSGSNRITATEPGTNSGVERHGSKVQVANAILAEKDTAKNPESEKA